VFSFTFVVDRRGVSSPMASADVSKGVHRKMSDSLYVIFGYILAFGLRWWLATHAVSARFLRSRVEVSSPINSWRRGSVIFICAGDNPTMNNERVRCF